MSESERQFDCVVCGSCVVDLLCHPVPLNEPIGQGVTFNIEPMEMSAGGLTANSGIAMRRLGLRVGVLTYVGDDAWGDALRTIFQRHGVDTSLVATRSERPTSATMVAIDPGGQRSFFSGSGATKLLDAQALRRHADLWARTRMLLLGYYSRMPMLEPDLPEVLGEIRAAGCRTAMDAAGDGGTMSPLAKILPQLDVWVPSRQEACHQTGHRDPQQMIQTFRNAGAPGVVGIKLGTDGVLLSDAQGTLIHIPAMRPPGPVVDTTGAGDCFYAGLITGLLLGWSLPEAGRLGVAAGACCVTAYGGHSGTRNLMETARMAGMCVEPMHAGT